MSNGDAFVFGAVACAVCVLVTVIVLEVLYR